MLTPLTRGLGAAVAVIDHVAKAAGGRYARGSGMKLGAADIAWTVERVAEFDRGRMGAVELRRAKNRPGCLPATVRYRVGGEGGRLVVAREGGEAPMDAFDRLPEGAQAALRLLRQDAPVRGAAFTAWRGMTTLAGSTFERAVRQLVDGGWVRKAGEGRNAPYVITAQAEDALGRRARVITPATPIPPTHRGVDEDSDVQLNGGGNGGGSVGARGDRALWDRENLPPREHGGSGGGDGGNRSGASEFTPTLRGGNEDGGNGEEGTAGGGNVGARGDDPLQGGGNVPPQHRGGSGGGNEGSRPGTSEFTPTGRGGSGDGRYEADRYLSEGNGGGNVGVSSNDPLRGGGNLPPQHRGGSGGGNLVEGPGVYPHYPHSLRSGGNGGKPATPWDEEGKRRVVMPTAATSVESTAARIDDLRRRMAADRHALDAADGHEQERLEGRLLATGCWLAVETLAARCDAGDRRIRALGGGKGDAEERDALIAHWQRLMTRALHLIALMARADAAVEEEFAACETARALAAMEWPDAGGYAEAAAIDAHAA